MFFECFYMLLEVVATALLLWKTVCLRSTHGLSKDMLVCSTIAAVLLPLAYWRDMLSGDYGIDLLSMYGHAVAMCVGLYFYLKASNFSPIGVTLRLPAFLSWRCLVPVGVILGSTAYFFSTSSFASPTMVVSVYLDCLGKLPQIWLLSLTKETQMDIPSLLFCCSLIVARAVEVATWVILLAFNDIYVLLPIMMQTVMGADVLYLAAWAARRGMADRAVTLAV